MITLRFQRKRTSQDPKDVSFVDDHACFYFMFVIRGGIYNPVNKKIGHHELVPSVSAKRICIRRCEDGKFNHYLYFKYIPIFLNTYL